MIKNLVSQLMLLIDSGKLLKSPVKWLYVLIGVLCFVPAIAFVVCLFMFWDFFIDLVGGNFWTNFVSIFVFILFFYTLVIFGLIGFHYWFNRRKNLDAIVKTGSRIIVIPLVADVNQSLGEVTSIFMVFISAAFFVLAYIACLLTNGFGFYTDWGFAWMLFGGAIGVALVALLAYLNVLLVRFFSERLRLLPMIGNDVHQLATTEKKELPREADDENVHIECPKFTDREKKLCIGAVACAAVVAIIAAFCLWIGNTVAMNKSIYKPLDDKRIEKLSDDYPMFGYFYSDVRPAADNASAGKDADKYQVIKYKRLYKFQNSINTPGNRYDLREQGEKDYFKQFITPRNAEVEAELNKWNQFILDNDPAPYLNVTINTGIYREEDWWSSYYRPDYYFTLEQPKGELSDAKVTLKILNSNGKVASSFSAKLSELKKVNSKTNAWHNSNFDDKNFWNSHKMVAEVTSVTIDGKTISNDAMKKVPASVKVYMENPTDMNKIDIVRECVDANTPEYNEWINEQIENKVKAADELCYEFVANYME